MKYFSISLAVHATSADSFGLELEWMRKKYEDFNRMSIRMGKESAMHPLDTWPVVGEVAPSCKI